MILTSIQLLALLVLLSFKHNPQNQNLQNYELDGFCTVVL